MVASEMGPLSLEAPGTADQDVGMPALTVAALLAHVDHVHAVPAAGGPRVVALLLAALPFVAGGVLLLRSRHPLTSTVVLFSAAAGFVHAMVTPQHFQEGLAVGVFTLAITVGQLGGVVAGLNRPSRGLWVATVAGNAAVLAVWALSRTTGLPVGPQPWTAEPVGLVDLACAAYEAAIVAGSVTLTGPRGLTAASRCGAAPLTRAGALPAV
jgi:hypothetical protein